MRHAVDVLDLYMPVPSTLHIIGSACHLGIEP